MEDWLTKSWCIQSVEHQAAAEKSDVDLQALTSNNINMIMSSGKASCPSIKHIPIFVFKNRYFSH